MSSSESENNVLDELERLEKAATPGPWKAVLDEEQPQTLYRGLIAAIQSSGADGYKAVVTDGRTCEFEQWGPNAALIAASRNALPSLLRIAKEVADAHPEIRVIANGRALAECQLCHCDRAGENPYRNQPESVSNTDAWDNFRKRSGNEAAALVADINHAEECAYIAARKLAGGAP